MHRRRILYNVPLNLLTYVLVLLFVAPVLWMVLTSFKTEVQAYALPPLLVWHPTLDNYASAFASSFGRYLVHSVVVALVAGAIAMILGALAGYSLAISPARRARNVLFFVISTRFMPFAAIVVPFYTLFESLHMLDTPTALIIVYIAMNLPIVVWMARSYFRDVPREVLDAAQIDGASTFQLLRTIMLPLAAPGLAAAGLLVVVFNWNEFLFALNLTYTGSATLPVLVSSFMTTQGLYWARLSALDTVVILPPVVLGLLIQRHLVRGLTAGAIR